MYNTEIRAYYNPAICGVEIYVSKDNRSSLPIIEWEEQETFSLMSPTFRLSEDAAQALMDTLFAAGFRPSEGHGSAGQREALEKHLADMRTIAFDKLKIEKP